ncbi:MAG: copper resistance protein CopZ [Clostridiales bacterium 43-6]|nr:MAG: copper resistance protein CopZ [Clostridiales bacterium 43-6]
MALAFITFHVEGMSCSHCENAVKKSVGALTGVNSVTVSLENKTVSVEYDPELVTTNTISDMIDDQGYDVI